MFNIAKLLPKEHKFCDLLRQISAECLTGSSHLRTMVEDGNPAKRHEAYAAITACKAQAKKISAEVTRELCLTFITPFDREDIQDLTTALYRVIKTIDKLSEYLEIHKVVSRDDLLAQIDVIISESAGMDSMLHALIEGGKTKQILEQAALLDSLENRGDIILNELLVKLIRDTTDARQLILRKDIYDMLERIIDLYRDAASVALKVALKHS